jgi:hypothetical protein
MLYSIKVPLNAGAGDALSFDLIPKMVPGINGRQSITGVFKILKKHDTGTQEHGAGDQEETTCGRLIFLNENFFEWRYEGNMLNEQEVHQIVDYLQNHAEEIFNDIGRIPHRRRRGFGGLDDLPGMSKDLLNDPEVRRLMAISPYFLFGPEDDLVAIVQNSTGYDILINDVISAKLQKNANDEWQVTLPYQGLFEEIIRRIEAINNLS